MVMSPKEVEIATTGLPGAGAGAGAGACSGGASTVWLRDRGSGRLGTEVWVASAATTIPRKRFTEPGSAGFQPPAATSTTRHRLRREQVRIQLHGAGIQPDGSRW